MALTRGFGPFGEKRSGTFNFEEAAPGDHALYLEDSPRRVRVFLGGEIYVAAALAVYLRESL
ncbi:MAG: hypothetical protein ACRDTR_09920 [Rubrobacter sp.]